VPPGGYGCDLTFTNDEDANVCLAPLHFSQADISTILEGSGGELTVDAYEPAGAHRSVYIVISTTQPPLSSGAQAPLGPQSAGAMSGVFTLSGVPNENGIIEFEAQSGSAVLTHVAGADVTFTIDAAAMIPYAPDPTNQEGRGSFTASVSCHVQATT
jgi:hypothetical protein